MTILGVPKRGKITSWNILRACLASAALHGKASTHGTSFGYVVDGDEDVLTILGLLECPHEVNAQHIKYFYLKVVVEGHCIARRDATLQLAFSTPSDEFFGVFVHRLLEESALSDFGLSAECSIVASVQSCMAFFDDLYPLCHRHAPS